MPHTSSFNARHQKAFITGSTSPRAGKSRATPEVSPLIEFVVDAPVTPHFARKVDRAIRSLPEHVQQVLYNAGIRVVATRFITDAFPDLKGKTPRGWSPGTTWDNADGMFMYEKHKIVLAQHYWTCPPVKVDRFKHTRRIRRGAYVMPVQKVDDRYLMRNIAADRLFRHEAGHAVDEVLKYISQSEAFKRAYMSDYRMFKKQDKLAMYYHIQPDTKTGKPTAAGLSEAFAEAFASLYGGGANHLDHFKKHFKHTMAFVEQVISPEALKAQGL
jgi:hypothetical protein